MNKLGIVNLKELLLFIVGIAVGFHDLAHKNRFQLIFSMLGQAANIQNLLAKLPLVKAEIEDLTADERLDLAQTIMQEHNIALQAQAEKLIFDGLESVSGLFKLGEDIAIFKKA